MCVCTRVTCLKQSEGKFFKAKNWTQPISSIHSSIHKSSIIINLVRQFTEEIQIVTAHLKKKKHLTSLITQETEVKSKAFFPSDISKDKAEFSSILSTQRAQRRASMLYIRSELYIGALLDSNSPVLIKIENANSHTSGYLF